MTRFASRRQTRVDIPAPREDVWALLSAPDSLAELTPLIKGITADGNEWIWQMESVSLLGIHIEPTFTEQMSFEEGSRIAFEHAPLPGQSERAGSKGVYELEDGPDGGTRLVADVTLHVELPLPGLSRRAVERAMEAMMARTGDQFADNLFTQLGITEGWIRPGK